MRLDEPWWWYPAGASRVPTGLVGRVLQPLGHAYGFVTARRMARPPLYTSRFPVVCIGNLTVGGTGKTPLAIAVAGLLEELAAEPWVLTRGYGGTIRGPHRVDPAVDGAADTGDEPMLLAAHAPVVVARDRAAGAAFVDATAPANTVIIMDDGLQNPSLAKDLTLCVVDQRRGIGNGRVFPAGPLRAPVAGQLARIDAVVIMRTGETQSTAGGFAMAVRKGFPGPVLVATTEPVLPTGGFGGTPLVAFAGIANPDRFFDTLARAGGRIVERRSFPDHHRLSETEATDLLVRAERAGGSLITTAKDHARLHGAGGACARLAARSQVLAIKTVFQPEERERLASLLRDILARR